jgi:hypothetical protein
MDAYTTNNIIALSSRDAPSTRQSFKVQIFWKKEIYSLVRAGFAEFLHLTDSFMTEPTPTSAASLKRSGTQRFKLDALLQIISWIELKLSPVKY